MECGRTPDRLSSLSDYLLVLVISMLPFKEALKTSCLSQRWKHLCYKTTNISFKESEFVKSSVSVDEETKRAARVSFVSYMVDWVAKFSGEAIESFELSLAKPFGFETEIKSLIEFAVSKQVKKLDLDFSDPSWRTTDEAAAERSVFQLPECVYNIINLESLKLFGCGFDQSRLANPGSIKSLSFGWIKLGKIESLLSRAPLVESLSITKCWNVDLETITRYNNRLIELIFENCDFAVAYSALDLSNIQIFKYSGDVHYFQFMEVNRRMKEAYLDFSAETEYDDATGVFLGGLLYDLSSAKSLTVCPFLLQLIQHGDEPIRLQAPMETRHLVMKTNLQPNEFVGIRLLINSCRELKTLTFVMVPHRPVLPLAAGIDPQNYWSLPIVHRCLNKTLKFVEVRNFSGGVYEMIMLQYLMKYGRVLERVDLFLSEEAEEGHRIVARAATDMIRRRFERASFRLRISLYNA